jgi:thymidylate synthase ThyX
MTATAKVIEDSINTSGPGVRLVTMQLRYPRFVHAEFMTHRVFSRNASSSRAIPVAKMIEQVQSEPAMPVHWGKNQPGMQAREEVGNLDEARLQWRLAARQAADTAERMMELGLHKQVANRILEPFQFISAVVTATEWSNFFELRDHEDADPNIQVLARAMKEAMDASKPVTRYAFDFDAIDSWHLPYVTAEERQLYQLSVLIKLSVARCARVSYLTHDGVVPEIAKDLELYERLVGAHPIHASPTEHQARAMKHYDAFYKNFRGWRQHRVDVEARIASK